MRTGLFYLAALSVIIIFQHCSTRPAASKVAAYQEDISIYLPDYSDSLAAIDTTIQQSNVIDTTREVSISGPGVNEITAGIDNFVEEIAKKNRNTNFYVGYTIQIYSGTSREEANAVKDKAYVEMDGSRPRLRYEQPNYKVTIGKYNDKINAQRVYNDVKKIFPRAIVIPERFKLGD